YLLIKTSDEGFSSFAPTVCDILADDWAIVE
ncbi:Thoeris anti-defense Tad2 family protein, partial [Enterococcus faecium]